jgi:hypothetical protein
LEKKIFLSPPLKVFFKNGAFIFEYKKEQGFRTAFPPLFQLSLFASVCRALSDFDEWKAEDIMIADAVRGRGAFGDRLFAA